MKKNKYGVFPIIGIVFGAIVIILGITLLGQGDTAGHASFGADFYTYSYRASRYAANNLVVLIQAMAYLLIAFGLFDIAFFGCKLVAGMPPKPRMVAPVYNGAMPNNANPGYQAPQPSHGYGAQPRPATPPYGNTLIFTPIGNENVPNPSSPAPTKTPTEKLFRGRCFYRLLLTAGVCPQDSGAVRTHCRCEVLAGNRDWHWAHCRYCRKGG